MIYYFLVIKKLFSNLLLNHGHLKVTFEKCNTFSSLILHFEKDYIIFLHHYNSQFSFSLTHIVYMHRFTCICKTIQ